MGERKGQNHYYPPDYDPNKGGLNKFLGTHALRERARKLHLGILIIRFEMPYNIWCDGCQQHVGMGVRYNAEKTKVGMYYSTPVYQFKMKCTMCDNHYVIKTDPGNLDYVIVSGARRQENRWDPTDNGQVVPDDKNVQKRLFDDAMFKLEHGERDKGHAKSVGPVLGRLEAMREERWKDDYAANCALRAKFRVKRRELKEKAEQDSALLARSGLEIALQPETEEDRKMARLLSLAPSRSLNERKQQTRNEIVSRPALPSCFGNATTFMGVRASKQLAQNVDRATLGVVNKRARTVADGTSESLDYRTFDIQHVVVPSNGREQAETVGKPTSRPLENGTTACLENGSFNIQHNSTVVLPVNDDAGKGIEDCGMNGFCEPRTDFPDVVESNVAALRSSQSAPKMDSDTCESLINNKSLVCEDYDFTSSDDNS